VTVQLHTLPETLREGELFGWRRGAFTGAQRDHEGAVSRAGDGTLFIDEVDKLPPDAQARLLRLLEERRYTVLGEAVERTTRARFIVGTNADLETAVEEGRFLRDLYYRINVLPVKVPTLQERRDEIGRWALHMLGTLSPGARPGLSRAAVLELERQPWPGNLRQLQSVVTRAFALATMDQGPDGPVVGAAYVERALGMDAAGGTGPLRKALEAAADALVAEAQARAAAGAEPLGLEELDVFKGLVLAAAIQATGDEGEACRLLGLGRLVKWSNHRKVIRREHGRVAALYERLGLPAPWDPLHGG
jgi:DNA-binding NtrC family response regulator